MCPSPPLSMYPFNGEFFQDHIFPWLLPFHFWKCHYLGPCGANKVCDFNQASVLFSNSPKLKVQSPPQPNIHVDHSSENAALGPFGAHQVCDLTNVHFCHPIYQSWMCQVHNNQIWSTQKRHLKIQHLGPFGAHQVCDFNQCSFLSSNLQKMKVPCRP